MSTKDFSSKQEKTIASALGFHVVSGSGARPNTPGDVSGDQWLGECKTHISDDHRIQFINSVWDKILDEAATRFKFAVLFVDDGSQTLTHTWCMFNARPDDSVALIEVNQVSDSGKKIIQLNKNSISFVHDDLLLFIENRQRELSKYAFIAIRDGRKVRYISTFEAYAFTFF